MRDSWQTLMLVSGAALVTAVSAPAQYRPEVPVLKCAHEGEPVPGISGALFQYFYPPGIDAAGSVLISASMTGPGITAANNEGIWFGQPGALSLVARDGWAAPDLPGVVFSSVAAEIAAVSENGWIVFTAYLAGSGVTPDVNDCAVFCGPPGDIHLVKRTSDPVPELGTGIVISGTDLLGACISDHGTILVGAGLAGSGMPSTYDRAYWIGPRGGLQLVAWTGMPIPDCPTCNPAAYLAGVAPLGFNDAGQVVLGGVLAGPGVHWYDNQARFIGLPGALTMTLRRWQFVPEFGSGIRIADFDTVHAMNSYGDEVSRIQVTGTGVSGANDWALVEGEPEAMTIIAREGDPTPEAGAGTYIATVSSPFINDLHQVLFTMTFGGASIGDQNRCAAYYGRYADRQLILRDGQPAEYLPDGTVLHQVGWVQGTAALNDVGDFVAVTPVERDAAISNMVWMWREATTKYVPLLLDGATIDARMLTLADPYELYHTLTGGADGLPQSFNDRRQLTTLLDFTDGTSGVYRIGPPLLGDTDADGQVGPPELLAYANCTGEVAPGCEPLDLNLDGKIDVSDLALLQGMVGEER